MNEPLASFSVLGCSGNARLLHRAPLDSSLRRVWLERIGFPESGGPNLLSVPGNCGSNIHLTTARQQAAQLQKIIRKGTASPTECTECVQWALWQSLDPVMPSK